MEDYMINKIRNGYKLANLSYDEMNNALPKLKKCILKLKEFDIRIIKTGSEVALQQLSQKFSQLIIDIFGNDTHEYYQYNQYAQLTTISMSLAPDRNIQAYTNNKIQHAISTLETIEEHFSESLEDSGRIGSKIKSIKAYDGLELHPKIALATSCLFHDGHYSNAIEDAVKELNAIVRFRTGLEEDGVALMQKAFSPKNPYLLFNSLSDESDRNEQKGFMDWFTGTVSGLRNPRAHKIIKDDPEMALEFIAFISLQAKLVDKAILSITTNDV